MTFIRRFQVKNRNDLLLKAGEIAKSKDKDNERFVTALKVTLLPIWVTSKAIQWGFKIPMYICIGIGTAFEYLDEATEDIYHISEDGIFLTLYKFMKTREDK